MTFRGMQRRGIWRLVVYALHDIDLALRKNSGRLQKFIKIPIPRLANFSRFPK